MEKIDEFELIPDSVAREIEENGAIGAFTASDGSEYIQCDMCMRWACEKDILMKRGSILCKECAEKAYESPVPPLVGEIDLGEGGLFRPAPGEEWKLIDLDQGRWVIHGDHMIPVDYGVLKLATAILSSWGYEREDDWFVARGVYLAVTVDDITRHPQMAGWLEYQIE